MLGDTRELIAKQKTGIMRAEKPTICGDLDPPAEVFDIAKKLKSKLFCIQKDFHYTVNAINWTWHFNGKTLPSLPNTKVLFQNAATVLMAIECLQGRLDVSELEIKKGLQHVQLLGRQQLIKYHNIPLLIDVAHNIDAVSLLVEKVQQLKCQGNVRLVFGVMKDKDHQLMLKLFSSFVDEWYISQLPSQRSLSVEDLCSNMAALNMANYKAYQTPIEAFDDAISQSSSDDLIVICGSFLTVASVLEKISGSIVEDRSR